MPEELLIEGLPPQSESFAVQLSNNDQRFTACVTDAAGRTFVAWHDTNLNVVLCELLEVADRLKLVYRAGPVPGAKNSCVALCIERDDHVRAFYGARPAGATSGEFPLMTEELRVTGVRSVSGEFARLWAALEGAGSGDATRLGAVEKVTQALGERLHQAGAALVGE